MNNYEWAGRSFFVIGLIIVLLILIDDHKRSKEMVLNNKQLPFREISGIVSSAGQNRGTIKLRLTNNEVFYFSDTRNYNLQPNNLDEFIQSGDSVYKKENSMNLEVYRNKERFEFVLEKSINGNR